MIDGDKSKRGQDGERERESESEWKKGWVRKGERGRKGEEGAGTEGPNVRTRKRGLRVLLLDGLSGGPRPQ